MSRKASAEALALLAEGEMRRTGAVPPEVAPLLKELSDLAKAGRELKFNVLKDGISKKVGMPIGRDVLRRWIREAGGEPWFSGK